MHHQIAHEIMLPGRWITPRTTLDTAITHRPFFVEEIETSAFLDIELPSLIAIVHDLVTRRNGSAGTVLRANLAVLAKILQTEIDGLVWNQWHLGEYCRGFVSQPKIWI